MPIICFFGPDGSGKTSLAKIAALTFANSGHKVIVSWMRGTHTFSFILSRTVFRHKIFERKSQKIVIPTYLRHLWDIIEFISMMPILIVRFILPDLLGFWIFADRYTPDFIVWSSIISNNENCIRGYKMNFLMSLAKKAKAKFYVTADINVLKRRSQESEEFLAAQLKLYRLLARSLGAYILNTTEKSIEKSLQEIVSLINL